MPLFMKTQYGLGRESTSPAAERTQDLTPSEHVPAPGKPASAYACAGACTVHSHRRAALAVVVGSRGIHGGATRHCSCTAYAPLGMHSM